MQRLGVPMTKPVTPTPTAQAFASAVQPVAADTLIITDTEGLVASDVSIPTNDGAIPGYRAVPEGANAPPIVLVVQEIFGLHEHIKDVVRRLAKRGYLAVAPELSYRQGDVSKLPSLEAIFAVIRTIPDAQVLSDLDATAEWAKAQGGDPKRLAVTGFCWGGRVTWLYAAHQPEVRAAVAWYGRLEGDRTPTAPRFPIDVVAELDAPVLGLYGGSDQSIPLESVERMRRALEGQKSRSEVHVYPHAPHAFYADYRPSYRKDAAEDGFRRLLEWFARAGV
jgi:carboxymethylenebutenolidase